MNQSEVSLALAAYKEAKSGGWVQVDLVECMRSQGDTNRHGKFLHIKALACSLTISLLSLSSASCLSQIKHPAAEIYLAPPSRTQVLESSLHNAPTLTPDAAFEILDNSSRRNLYFQILDIARQSNLFDRSLIVLAELEQFHARHEISNYENWLNFLKKSREDELSHKIFEGMHAIYILKSHNALIAFEPRRGFFWDKAAHQARKSMDIEIRDPLTNQVISYKEVKQVYSYRNALGALESIISKAAFMRTVVGEQVELSAVIYVDAKIPQNISDEFYLRESLIAQTEVSKARILEANGHGRPNLDSLIIVDLNLGYYSKISLSRNAHETTRQEASLTEGTYPLIP